MTKNLIELIKKFEGCRLKAYKCPAGVWTIGYGHTDGVKEGDVITLVEAENMLIEDLKIYRWQVVKATEKYCHLNDFQIDALTSFNYNVGYGNLLKSTLLKKVRKDPNDASIRDEFKKWVYAGGKVLQGLVRRREAEANLYFS